VPRGRFDGLVAFLAGRSEREVELTFAELDGLITGGLPESARTQAVWWSNRRTAQPHARFWLDAGREAEPDLGAGTVVFRLVPGANRHAPFDPGPARPNSRRAGVDATRRSGALTVPASELTSAGHDGGTVGFTWMAAGEASVGADGTGQFPLLPASPGILRLTATRQGPPVRFLLGHSGNLASSTSGPDGARLAGWMDTAAGPGQTVEVSLVLRATLGDEALDLEAEANRRLVEALAVVNASGAGQVTVLAL
jgi:hypothetical protein